MQRTVRSPTMSIFTHAKKCKGRETMESNASTTPLEPTGKSALGIAGFVLGLIALCTSFLPIINNFSAFLAVLGLVFAVIGTVSCVRGKKSGKGLTIAGLIICIVSLVVVFATQNMYVKAIDEATSGASVTSTSQSSSSSSSDNGSQAAGDLPVGTTASLSNGLEVTVNSVTSGLANYNGEEFTSVTVTYTNTGSDTLSFNTYDWKAQDSQGAQRSATFEVGGDAADSSARLDSGSLAAKGNVTGVLEFDGQISKVIYSPSFISDKNNVTWVVS